MPDEVGQYLQTDPQDGVGHPFRILATGAQTGVHSLVLQAFVGSAFVQTHWAWPLSLIDQVISLRMRESKGLLEKHLAEWHPQGNSVSTATECDAVSSHGPVSSPILAFATSLCPGVLYGPGVDTATYQT